MCNAYTCSLSRNVTLLFISFRCTSFSCQYACVCAFEHKKETNHRDGTRKNRKVFEILFFFISFIFVSTLNAMTTKDVCKSKRKRKETGIAYRNFDAWEYKCCCAHTMILNNHHHHDDDAHQSTKLTTNLSWKKHVLFFSLKFVISMRKQYWNFCSFFFSLHQIIFYFCLSPSYHYHKDQRSCLVPWIIIMVVHIALEFVHFIYLLVLDTVSQYIYGYYCYY